MAARRSKRAGRPSGPATTEAPESGRGHQIGSPDGGGGSTAGTGVGAGAGGAGGATIGTGAGAGACTGAGAGAGGAGGATSGTGAGVVTCSGGGGGMPLYGVPMSAMPIGGSSGGRPKLARMSLMMCTLVRELTPPVAVETPSCSSASTRRSRVTGEELSSCSTTVRASEYDRTGVTGDGCG